MIESQTEQRALSNGDLQREVARRRTFAIISHPDAGKTTLTEKLLLYGGAVNLAGSVTARKHQRQTASDWMALERERGISISSTVLQFAYDGYQINLLDTPGHQDFSEDTYRTLMAADSAVMVLDAARGIEPQTLKLFEVCRLRRIPIFTFINKLDRPARDPLDLLDEIEQQLGLAVYPMNWPIGDGPQFQGVYDRAANAVHRYDRTEHGARRAPVEVAGLDDPRLESLIGAEPAARLREAVELLEVAGFAYDDARVQAGELTPVFFGSAVTNFGVQPFLDAFVELAPAPRPRLTESGPVSPHDESFSGFVFKVQANMDPRHRDRVAYLRVCSGRFERDMQVRHLRLERDVRLSRPLRLFGQEREVVEEGYAGDVIGLINPGLFVVGDTVSCAGGAFEALPRFQPEHFALLRNARADRYKQFQRGLTQIEEEGGIQLLYPLDSGSREPILAAAGALQFDVVRYRLEHEYGVETILEPLGYELARWVEGDPEEIRQMASRRGRQRAEDLDGRTVVLFRNRWDLNFALDEHPRLRFAATGGPRAAQLEAAAD
ncbi:MAG TPA: peptide chain release factor 3 [Solirubrobacterales bacterium]|nr:peptide chain release factor 3 [Solirubrobacterales bacterium]